MPSIKVSKNMKHFLQKNWHTRKNKNCLYKIYIYIYIYIIKYDIIYITIHKQ